MIRLNLKFCEVKYRTQNRLRNLGPFFSWKYKQENVFIPLAEKTHHLLARIRSWKRVLNISWNWFCGNWILFEHTLTKLFFRYKILLLYNMIYEIRHVFSHNTVNWTVNKFIFKSELNIESYFLHICYESQF